MKEETTLWLNQANEHLEDAQYLFDGSRYSMSVFCAHQALEKILKACIIEFASKIPPKSHNLDALGRDTRIALPESWYADLAEITRHFWRVRYPDFRRYSYTNKESVQPTLDKTKEVFQWILKQLNQR